ncbi:MAG: hypothetical protein UV89_C0039G0007 [candidate division WWE3 bacterium GW2011_GWB2_43_22]|uniref:Uncharacterized protein n=1 Tax=candidate division WWE3 bacterium GW2011_GWB2_43_22 TaxID=1619118 RepID=A0A0G1EGP1_UNCKA|nr:MAG: hypothetical protein UV89_C0039G0007 [candidate division WWE3 bacterium GW2011_GWB2_43_22]
MAIFFHSPVIKTIETITSATAMFLTEVKYSAGFIASTANLLTKIEKPEITAVNKERYIPRVVFDISFSYSGQTCLPVSVSMTTIAFVGHDCAAITILSGSSFAPSTNTALLSPSNLNTDGETAMQDAAPIQDSLNTFTLYFPI